MLVALKTLIEELKEDKKLADVLSSFSCSQDPDIEYFLHHRAVEFERLSKSRTYLVYDQDELLKNTITDAEIYGYISVALKVLKVPSAVSNRVRKNLDGFSAKIGGEPLCNFPCYLIGQLARNSETPRDRLTGNQLIEFAKAVISPAVRAVGGRYMLVECRDTAKLISFYEKHGFQAFAQMDAQGQPFVQMIRKI